MSAIMIPVGSPFQMTASGIVGNQKSFDMMGVFVSKASNTPTITIYDGTNSAGTLIVDTFTPVAGTWYPLPFSFGTSMYLSIGGTVSLTVSGNQGQ
jgi:hypothetical protein